MATAARPWRFAPLDKSKGNPENRPDLAGIVFDVDGTLCEPQNYMFAEMRALLGIPKSVDILHHLQSLPEEKQREAFNGVHEIERRAMKVQKPQPGLLELMKYLDGRGIRKGICTRNFDEPITHLLTTFLPGIKFDPIVTRAFTPPKPDPAGILHIASSWGIAGEEKAERMIMVGDSIDDMTAGARAGAVTVLLVNKENDHLRTHENTHVQIAELDELINVLELAEVAPVVQS
ncbi:MAG: hypothetical protein M1828_001408 [Chrysothrix sp. TS-e1954]|nr:MAG: hypothetical protein M1828_001408 [Chrysothrix sp. TS-e1954]